MHNDLHIVNPISYQGWNELLLSNPNYTFFHSFNWAKVLYNSYKYQPLYIIHEIDHRLATVFPLMEINSIITGKRGVSLPFSDFCKPLIGNTTNINNLIEYIINYGKKRRWKYFEIRDGYHLFKNEIPYATYYEHLLLLNKNIEKLYLNLKGNVKRNIKRAIREEVKISFHTNLGALKEFYRLNCITRKHHKLPPQPFSFFHSIFKNVIDQDMGIVSLANHKDRIIAASVYFFFGDKVLYKYGASDRRYQSLRANNLIMWETIKWFANIEFKVFSFGRTNPNNTGLMQFKNGWGGHLRKIYYYRYNLRDQCFMKSRDKSSIISDICFRYTPVYISKMVGRLIYRHMG